MDNKEDKRDLEKDLKEVFKLRRKIKQDREYLEDLFSKFEKGKSTKTRRILRISSAAAAILLISLWVLSPVIINPDSGKLYNRYYQSFDPDLLTRDEGQLELVEKGILAYKSGEIITALEILSQLEKVNPDNREVTFFHALALLENNQPDLAREKLEVLEKESDFMPVEVLWYLGLIELKSGNYDKTRELFERIKELDPDSYKKEIRRIRWNIRFRKECFFSKTPESRIMICLIFGNDHIAMVYNR
jgi:tetratricopeptide (TPR) repeat protein